MDLNNATKFTGSELSDPAEIFKSKSKDRNMFVNHNQSERRLALATIACKSFAKFITFGYVLLQLLEIHCISVWIAALRQKAF